MGKIVISENVSLDGVVQDPTGEEGFKHGGWFTEVTREDREAWTEVELDEVLRADAVLLGRRSYEFFVARWPQRVGAFADRFNGMPKYVVSSVLQDPSWDNSTVLRGDVVAEVSKLKQSLSGDIVVYASGDLVRTLIEHELIDEVRLMIYPVVLGSGRRLFGETSVAMGLQLLEVRRVGASLAYVTYVAR